MWHNFSQNTEAVSKLLIRNELAMNKADVLEKKCLVIVK